jgi:hypothetical protein
VAGGSAGGPTNQAPVVSGIALGTTSMQLFAGQRVTLTADVLDNENDPLTFSWSAPDGGTLSDPTAASPTWYSPEVTTNTGPFPEFTLRVEVSDGRNPPVAFEQTVQVRAPRFMNLLNDSVIGSTAFAGCSNSSCHGSSTSPTGGFAINRFSTSAAHTAITANHAKGASCGIATKRVQAFQPMQSLLYRKLLGGLPFACGAQMPLNRGSVEANQLIIIRSWINAGALNN